MIASHVIEKFFGSQAHDLFLHQWDLLDHWIGRDELTFELLVEKVGDKFFFQQFFQLQVALNAQLQTCLYELLMSIKFLFVICENGIEVFVWDAFHTFLSIEVPENIII